MQLLKIKEVMAIVHLGRSTIYRKMKDGEFPKHFRTGKRAVHWKESEVREWYDSLKTAKLEDLHSPNRQ